ncbi:MAG: DUF1501 domain-containing protein [Gemmataceae bacterium]|nr:DUF1501 domain-containing protein [Gemmata sp.]MDW8197586.1 DUF1501 domain-containing protein [Gemmataceae bacterium]
MLQTSWTTSSTRRDFLRGVAAGAVGWPWAAAVRGGSATPPRRRAQSCIVINMVGGPAQLDTFDPKPAAPSEVRGPFRPIATTIPGLHLSELFPRLAQCADRFSLIRSLYMDAAPVHECGFQLLNTGRLFRDGPDWPSVGSVFDYLGASAGAGSEPRAIITPYPQVETGIPTSRGEGSGWLQREPMYWSPQLSSPHDFLAGVVERVERGPCFIRVNQFPTVFDAPSWDCHAVGGSLRTNLADIRDIVAPSFDRAVSQLLMDLDDRGLLDTTLVVATGEFGRTPRINPHGGRDHWAECWTALVAGGGVQGGRIIGASDATGSEPRERPVSLPELVATIFYAGGIPPEATLPGVCGEPVAVYPAAPVMELF